MSWRATGQRVGTWLARAYSRRVNVVSGPQRFIELRASSQENPIDLRRTPARLISTLGASRMQGVRLRTRAWRRRILLRKGARIHVGMVNQSDACSLAILDTEGLVVCWYDGLPDRCTAMGDVVNRHVAQFYAPTHLAGLLACEHLRRAASQGTSTQTGWRRQPGGAAFWATTEIKPFVLRDGRIQGFLHIIRSTAGPQQHTAVLASHPYLYAAAHYSGGVSRAASNGLTAWARTLDRSGRSSPRMPRA